MGRSGTIGAVIWSVLVASALGACGMTTHPSASPASTPTRPASSPLSLSLSLQTEPGSWPRAVDAFIGTATANLDMTMYELADTQAEHALAAAAARGVSVRVLLNADYAGRSANQTAYTYLSSHGVAVRWAAAGTIFHQKSITVDQRVSAVMTGNLTSRYYDDTRDFVVIDAQPGDVDAIAHTFGADWSGAPTVAEPTVSDLVWSPGAAPALIGVIDGARATLTVENEEMRSTPIEAALQAAAARGVAVHLVMTADPEWDAASNALISAGVQVRTYPNSAGVLYIHAKAIVADAGLGDQVAYVGSQNFSDSSIDRNRELGIITRVPVIVSGLAAVIGNDFADATPYQPS